MKEVQTYHAGNMLGRVHAASSMPNYLSQRVGDETFLEGFKLRLVYSLDDTHYRAVNLASHTVGGTWGLTATKA